MSRPTTELTHLFRQLKAPAAARALRAGRPDVSAETPVEIRPLTRYDALIA